LILFKSQLLYNLLKKTPQNASDNKTLIYLDPYSLVLAPEVPKALAEDTANPETLMTNTS